jgi:hypothetical protein
MIEHVSDSDEDEPQQVAKAVGAKKTNMVAQMMKKRTRGPRCVLLLSSPIALSSFRRWRLLECGRRLLRDTRALREAAPAATVVCY